VTAYDVHFLDPSPPMEKKNILSSRLPVPFSVKLFKLLLLFTTDTETMFLF